MPCGTKLSSNKNAKSNPTLTPDNLGYKIYIYIYLHGNSLARRGGLDPARFPTPLTEPPLRFRTGN